MQDRFILYVENKQKLFYNFQNKTSTIKTILKK